jgi:hypothetical protein
VVSGGVITGVGFNVGLGLEGNPASSPNVVAGAVLDEVENKIPLPIVLLNTKAKLSERTINLNNIGAIFNLPWLLSAERFDNKSGLGNITSGGSGASQYHQRWSQVWFGDR